MLSNTIDEAKHKALKYKNKDLKPFTLNTEEDAMPHPADNDGSTLNSYFLQQRDKNA